MKYDILMSCGHQDTVELFGKNSDRERKIEYFRSRGLCKECYKKKKMQESSSEALIFNASALPYIDEEDGSILLSVWFSGNTRPYKDMIKGLGYRWGNREAAEDFYSAQAVMCWSKTIKIEELQKEIAKAKTIGANSAVADNNLYEIAHYQIALQRQEEWKNKREKISTIPKPTVPDVLAGRKWNGKLYGKAGNYSVYPDGEKVSLTDQEAEEIKNYIKEKEEYNKKVKEIKNV